MIRVFLNRVLVLPDDAAKKSKGGIILPDEVQEREQYSVDIGVVIGMGPNAWQDYGDGEPQCKTGDRVIFKQYSGSKVRVGEDTHWMMNDEDILGEVVEDE